MKPLVPENINVNHTVNINVNTADVADLTNVIADNAAFVMLVFTACSIARTVVQAVVWK